LIEKEKFCFPVDFGNTLKETVRETLFFGGSGLFQPVNEAYGVG